MAKSDPTAFVVSVLEGPAAGVDIPLEGRALPYRAGAGGSISFGTEQRSKLVWYPGNPVATHLIFGPQLTPTTINGVWKDRYLGTDAAIDLVDLFTELSESGVQVRVLYGSLEYQGIVKGVSFQPGVPTGGLGDIAWSIVFEWNSRRGLGPRRIVGTADKTLRDGIVSAATTFGSLRQLTEEFVGTVRDLHGLPSVLASSFRTSVADLLDEGNAALATLATVPVDLGQLSDPPPRLLEDAGTALSQGLDVSGDMGETVAGAYLGVLTPRDDIETQLGLYLDQHSVVAQAFVSLERLWEEIQRVEAQTRPDAFVLLRPVRRTDLRSIALLYYGSADLWPRIARVNGIVEGSLLPDDVDELLVPLSLSTALEEAYAGIPDVATETGASA